MGCDRRIILIVLPPRDQSREPIFPSAPTRLITPTRFPPPSMRLQFHSSLRPSVKQSTFVLPFRTLILVHPVPLRASWQHSTSSGKPGASRMARKAARRGSGPRSATVRRSAGGGGGGDDSDVGVEVEVAGKDRRRRRERRRCCQPARTRSVADDAPIAKGIGEGTGTVRGST